LPNLSRDLTSYRGNNCSGLTQNGGLYACLANLASSINLAYIDSLVGIKLFPIIELDSATRLSRSALITTNGLTGTRIHTCDLCACLSVSMV
jgi:hypothetical protein